MVSALMISPTRNVLSMYPAAIPAGLMGVTRMSLALPLALSSIMVWRDPADVVTGTMPSMPARTQASISWDIPSMSG